jgi:FMN-dependent NADH-azoreductase
MPTLLRVDASSRPQGSHSRDLADFFVQQWTQANPQGEIIVRDLVREPIPHISEITIAGFYTPHAERDETLAGAIELSDRLIGEITAADVLLIDTPMYNFSIPSALKAWIDQVVRMGETFAFSPEDGFTGLVTGKQAFVVTATGAEFSNEALRPMDFMTPYLTALLGFLGLTEVQLLCVEGTTTDPEVFERSKLAAHRTITQLWSES